MKKRMDELLATTRLRTEWTTFRGHRGKVYDWEQLRHGRIVAHLESLWLRHAVYLWQHGHWVFLFH